MLLALQSCSAHRDTRFSYFGFARKAFLSTIFLVINVHPWNETNLDTQNNIHFFVIGTLIMFSTLAFIIWCFGFARKAFLSNAFLVIQVYLWNEANLGAHNNLHSFCYWHYNHVCLIEIHDIYALDLQENLFFPPFSL